MTPETPEAGKERRISRLEHDMEYVLKTLDGKNNEPGLISRLSNHIDKAEKWWSAWQAREDDKKIYDDRMEKTMLKEAKERAASSESIRGWLIVVATAVGVVITLGSLIIGVLAYEHETKHSLFSQHREVYADYNIQNATK